MGAEQELLIEIITHQSNLHALPSVMRQTPRLILAQWIAKLLAKKPAKLVAIAVANRTARIAWAIMAKGGKNRPAAIAASA